MSVRPIPQRGRPSAPDPGTRYVVRVLDVVDEQIAGHLGCSYASPAQSRGEALALAALLLGSTVTVSDGRLPWSHTIAIAGGRRTVTLEHA